MPPIDDNEIEELASSANSDLDAQNEAAEAAKTVAANSSSATGETDEPDLLSVVRDVVKEKRSSEQTAPPADSVEETVPTANDGKGKDADDEFANVPFNKHPRFQGLVRERNALRVDAERYNNVQTFIDNHGLSAEEAADGLVTMSLMKTNPAEAWKRMKPTIQKLLVAAGEVLPDDLREHVAKGEMSEAAAMEVSRSRASVQSVHTTRSFEQQRAQQREQQSAKEALMTTATNWEADRRLKDPNFDAKMEPLRDRVYALQRQEGIPNTPAGVTEQLNRAYKGLVVAAPKPAIVPPRAVTPIRGGQVAGNQQPEPKSILDVVRANRRTA